MKIIFKATTLLAAVLMFFCVTGCGDTAGGTPVTPAEPPYVAQETPLTLEAIQAGQITLTNPEKMTDLKYKKNGGNFVSVTADANTITVAAGDKIAFYADGSTSLSSTYFHIVCNHDCYVYGNVMSLLGSNFTNATVIFTDYAFYGLFENNTHIKNHSTKTLVLPATTLADSCYYSMFQGCTGLTSAPVLPATTLAASCYSGMFWDCTSLTSAPALPATTLAASCYSGMFWDCTSLTSAPVLPATTLAASCYSCMFYNCTSLSSVTCLATNISAEECTGSWLYNVPSSGTFTKPSTMTSWTEGASGIPSGWEVQNYSAQ